MEIYFVFVNCRAVGRRMIMGMERVGRQICVCVFVCVHVSSLLHMYVYICRLSKNKKSFGWVLHKNATICFKCGLENTHDE